MFYARGLLFTSESDVFHVCDYDGKLADVCLEAIALWDKVKTVGTNAVKREFITRWVQEQSTESIYSPRAVFS